MTKLPAKLRKIPFTTKEAAKLGISFYDLGKLVASGAVEQVARGIYRTAGGDIDEEEQFRIATLRVDQPAVICLVSALSYYHLTDTIPKKTWIMVPDTKRTTDRSLKLYRTRNPHWDIGIESHDGYRMTTIERTLVDCLTQRSRLGSQLGIEALRKATTSKKTTLGKILDMAIKLEINHRIAAYIEALA
jgi:predicted transcriptional regulator of viral defense system